MLYTIKNDLLTVTVSDQGAELMSVKRDNCEYIWQGDPTYWTGRAPVLFPFCGRLFEKKYTYRGKTYELGTHGFARHSTWELASATQDCLTFVLRDTDQTREVYPFAFSLCATYRLDGDTLHCGLTLCNTGDEVLPASLGAHPGFNVPLDGEGDLSDYVLEFGERCSPDELLFSDTCFNTGKKRAYPLINGQIVPLRHNLFDIDGVFFSNIPDTVTLKSNKTDRFVRMRYSNMPYLGIWHKPRTQAPYLCIEPWCGLPAYDGEIDDFETKNDMFRLLPNDQKEISYSITFG